MRDIKSNKALSYTTVLISLSFLLLLILTFSIYWPGLYGHFILDDNPNLSMLSTLNAYLESEEHRQYAATRFWLFVSEGVSSSLGRPIALLTFALQAPNWPTNPWAFKYVNVLIHLLNGCLLFILSIKITRALNIEKKQAKLIAILTTSMWILHPIHTSTVLYVIQRMTELSALFTLAGLTLYAHGRELIERGKSNVIGLAWMSCGILCGLTLGILSKENAILIVIYAAVMEYTCFQNLSRPRYRKTWSFVFLILPIALLISYLFIEMDSRILGSYLMRDFTLYERLLTETRILWDYIIKIVIPNPNDFGLFHDDFIISKSFTEPLSTLFSILSLSLMLIAALYFRKSVPVFSFAALWFLGGHILESTFIGLELYFDHRNYLPTYGILFAISHIFIQSIYSFNSRMLKMLLIASLGSLILLYSVITYKESSLWGQPHVQAITWLKENPDSKRALTHAASTYFELGHTSQAVQLLDSIIEKWPNQTGTYANKLLVNCYIDNQQLVPTYRDITLFHTTLFDRATLSALRAITELHEKSKCDHLDIDIPISFVKAILINPNFKSQYKDMHFVLGRLYARKGLLPLAMNELDQSYEIHPDVYVAMNQAQWLASAQLYDDAIIYLNKAGAASQSSSLKEKLFKNVLDEWRRDILEDKRKFLRLQNKTDVNMKHEKD